MSAEIIVRHCAPTLAGLKTGSLFGYRYDDEKALTKAVSDNNRMLNQKGVYFVILKAENGRALIYVYRKKALEQKLNNIRIRNFLKPYGYLGFEIASCLDVLRNNLKNSEFPHEIGLFLGYPIDDVIAFINNKGENCECCGCWKAYTNVTDAEKIFALYKKCTRIYCSRASEGTQLSKLTVRDLC